LKQSLCTIACNTEISPSVRLMRLEAPDIASLAKPGQFVTVRCADLTLRRPLSIHQVSPSAIEASNKTEIALLFTVTGKGTHWLAQCQPGEKIDILGPLGNSFDIEAGAKNLLLVAGGIGIAPLIFLAQHASAQQQITIIHGASTAAQLYPFSLTASKKQHGLIPLPDSVRFVPVTEDGSAGKKGIATDIVPAFLDWADQICACGPVGMYEAMASMSFQAKQNNLKLRRCQVSLEVRMGCGIGACYGCTIRTKTGLRQVCHDGPVFELDDVLWEELRI